MPYILVHVKLYAMAQLNHEPTSQYPSKSTGATISPYALGILVFCISTDCHVVEVSPTSEN
ncbi:hypothetical protein GW750_08885 [bacterium]|nr:hypothetical protein [bacterium]